MKFSLSATRLAALLSGAACGLGMPLLQLGQSALNLSPTANRLAFVASLVLLLFVPMMVFVVGSQHLSFDRKDSGGKRFMASLAQVGVRFLCWLLGAGLAFEAFGVLRSWMPVN